MKYASETKVSADRSKAEIERLLIKYGASKFMSGWQETSAIVGFEMRNRRLKFLLPLPSKSEDRFKFSPSRRKLRSEADAYRAWEQETRQRWRALALIIKAKLEAVESEISTFDEEFMPHIVLPNGETVAEHFIPQIEQVYQNKKMPLFLPGLKE